MTAFRFALAICFSLALFPLLLTGPAAADSAAMILPIDASELVAINPDGSESRFTVEIADDDDEQSAGLMFRLSMGDSHGMLFVFDRTRRLSFWMKNTPMPLDLIFVGQDGKVIDIFKGKPYSLSSIGPVQPARFVLEVKSGIAAKNGIVRGTVFRHPAIDAITGVK